MRVAAAPLPTNTKCPIRLDMHTIQLDPNPPANPAETARLQPLDILVMQVHHLAAERRGLRLLVVGLGGEAIGLVAVVVAELDVLLGALGQLLYQALLVPGAAQVGDVVGQQVGVLGLHIIIF
jgi:hypothetical protein